MSLYRRSSPPPRSRIIKEEQDYDQLEPSPPPHPSSVTRSKSNHTPRHEPANVPPVSSGAPPPSLVRPPTNTKRRRITVSTGEGAQQPSINTANLEPAGLQTPGGPSHPHVHTGPSTPISPVVMGLSFQRDNPEALEQVRAMLSVKQKQKALIESRRGSAAGLPDGRRGSAAGLSDGKRGSVAGIHDSKRNSTSSLPPVAVNIVNPTPTALTVPVGGALAPQKRSRSSPSVTAGRMPSPSGSTNGALHGGMPSTMNSSPRAKASGPGVPPNNSVQRTVSPQQAHVVPSQNPRGSMHLSPPSAHNVNHGHHARPSQSPSQGHVHPATRSSTNNHHPTTSAQMQVD